MAGIKDIAEHCGVSAATVSMALRNHSEISESRRSEIRSVADMFGYRPNVIAQSLRGGKTKSIGILWSLCGPHNSVGLIRSMTLKLMDASYVSYVADSISDYKIVKNCLKDYITRNIDGLIFQDGEKMCEDQEIIELLKKIPAKVIVDDSWENRDITEKLTCDLIERDKMTAMKDIIRFFKDSGRQRIGFIIRERHLTNRAEVFTEILKLYGLPTDNSFIINNFMTSTSLSDEVIAILSSGNIPYDAIITTNDEIAAVVISTLREAGVKVPEQVAVVGFNDNLMSQYFYPPLASVDRCDNKLATLAVEMLLERLENPKLPPRSESLAMKFVKRESAG